MAGPQEGVYIPLGRRTHARLSEDTCLHVDHMPLGETLFLAAQSVIRRMNDQKAAVVVVASIFASRLFGNAPTIVKNNESRNNAWVCGQKYKPSLKLTGSGSFCSTKISSL